MFKIDFGAGCVPVRIFFCLCCLAVVPSTAMAQYKQLFDDPHLMIPVHNDYTRALAVGDVDNDGDLDLFVGNERNQNRLFLNNGCGKFTSTENQLPTGASETHGMAVGDVDGDDDLDLFVINYMEQNQLFLNDGTGIFIDATSQLPGDLTESCSVALGDVDGDGDLDALIGNGGEFSKRGYNRLYLNDGSGVFSVATNQIPWVQCSTSAVALGDVDGDGDLDAFIGNAWEANHLYINDGAGWFSSGTHQIPMFETNTMALALGDVDGDSDLDVLIGARGEDFLFLNDGTGVFVDASNQIPQHDDASRGVGLGDVDGDGDLDALIGIGRHHHTSGTSNQDCLYLNDGNGVFSDATNQLPEIQTSDRAVSLADLDGDGDLDSLIGTMDQNRLYLNNGSGLFTDCTGSISFDDDWTKSVALGDIDGDGDLDAVAGNYGDSWYVKYNWVYINDGQGMLHAEPDRIPIASEETASVALGDVDNDGDLDLFVGHDWVGQRDRLYINNGNGWFLDASQLMPAGAITLCVVFGDVDGDEDLDIFRGTGLGGQSALYLNDGTGRFSNATNQIPSDSATTQAVAIGDVDGDYDLDLFLGNRYDLCNLYLNDGTGVFSDATNQIPPIGDDIHGVALGDVDGDGDLDAFLASGQDRLFLNDGTGVFSDATSQVPDDSFDSNSVILGDLDNDGDLDAFLVNDTRPGNRENTLYLNDGTGQFIDATILVATSNDSAYAAALGDLDADGDLDAFIGKSSQNRVLFNLTNHVAWQDVPRVGKPLSMEVHGPPNGWYILAASTHSDHVPMPPLGDLRLLLSAVFYRSSDSLDSEGRAVHQFEVPSIPALVGKRLYWQAFVWNPGHFTNLEVTTLTDL